MKTAFRYILALIYLIAGIAHLRSPSGFLQITPNWVPEPAFVIAVTGICEIAGAVALAFIARLRKAAGWGLAAYAVCVFPANINHAMNDIAIGGSHMTWWYHGPRLLFQPLFVYWALYVADITNWPFGSKAVQKNSSDTIA
jgi:uncharacterized membrane protein